MLLQIFFHSALIKKCEKYIYIIFYSLTEVCVERFMLPIELSENRLNFKVFIDPQ